MFYIIPPYISSDIVNILKINEVLYNDTCKTDVLTFMVTLIHSVIIHGNQTCLYRENIKHQVTVT